MVYYLFSTFYVVTCFILLLVILLQQGKGDMAAAFGGGSSQSAFGARAGATVLSKATAILAVLFMVGAMILSVMGQRGPGSVLSGTRGPAAAPVRAPITPAPGAPPASTTPATTPKGTTPPPAQPPR
jgi:preprotein translocase subunit SecG